ncbi:MAG: rhodanese-like domain-containing protein [Gaiellaceae bacterium]
MARRRTIDEVLTEARDGLRRLLPEEAWAAAQDGAVLVDVRSEDERRRQDALLPGAFHHPLSVVHWRLDPAVPTSNPKLPLDAHVILVCREGYSSSLAAALLRIGFDRATDVVGGVAAWKAAGLPLVPAERTRPRLVARA